MRVKLGKNYRKYYTLEDLDHANRVIAAEREDDPVKKYANMAIREALKNDNGIAKDYIVEILRAKAYTAKNRRVWNAYTMSDDDPHHETGDMDVWIEFAAELGNGYITGGAYLSDIWQTGGIDYREHMYIRRAEFI